MKNNKIESLPEDLKKVANKLVDKKFPEEPKTSYNPRSSGPSIEIPFIPNIVASFDKVDPMEDITYTTPRECTIDMNLKEQLRQFSHASVPIKLFIYFKPIGEFNRERYYHFNRQNETMRIDIYPGMNIDPLKRILNRLNELKEFYKGNFIAILDKYEINSLDTFGYYRGDYK